MGGACVLSCSHNVVCVCVFSVCSECVGGSISGCKTLVVLSTAVVAVGGVGGWQLVGPEIQGFRDAIGQLTLVVVQG